MAATTSTTAGNGSSSAVTRSARSSAKARVLLAQQACADPAVRRTAVHVLRKCRVTIKLSVGRFLAKREGDGRRRPSTRREVSPPPLHTVLLVRPCWANVCEKSTLQSDCGRDPCWVGAAPLPLRPARCWPSLRLGRTAHA